MTAGAYSHSGGGSPPVETPFATNVSSIADWSGNSLSLADGDVTIGDPGSESSILLGTGFGSGGGSAVVYPDGLSGLSETGTFDESPASGLVLVNMAKAGAVSVAHFNFCADLASFTLPTATGSLTVLGLRAVGLAAMPAVASYPALGLVAFGDNPALTTLPTFAGMASLALVLCSECAFTEETVDTVFIEMDDNGLSGGTIDVSGGTSAAPSSASDAARTSLEGKGWSLVFNSDV